MLSNMDTALLILRIVVGLLFAGHGAQKVFGWFGGPGIAGMSGYMGQMGLYPPRFWTWANALAEFLGGIGLALGLLTPLAAVALVGSMLVAIIKVHWTKGLWNHAGGLEFPLLMGAVAFVVGLTGAGMYSLDSMLGLALHTMTVYWILLILMLITIIVALVATPLVSRQQHEPPA